SAPGAACAARRNRFPAVHFLWRAAAGCGEPWRRRKTAVPQTADKKRAKSGAFGLICPLLQMQPFVSGVKTGYRHVFPIDNPATYAKIGIGGARALSLPPRLMRGN